MLAYPFSIDAIVHAEPAALVLHGAMLSAALIVPFALHRWPRGYAFALWPGTVAHELLHWVAGVLAGARPVSLSLLPRRQHDGHWTLGSVSFRRLRWWNSVPVSLAPVALLPLGGWAAIESTAWPLLSASSMGMKFLAAQCLLSGWPSRQDWGHALSGLAVLAVLAALSVLAIWSMPAAWISEFVRLISSVR